MGDEEQPAIDPYRGLHVDDVWYGDVAEDDDLQDATDRLAEDDEAVDLIEAVDVTVAVDLTAPAEAPGEALPAGAAVAAAPVGPPGMFRAVEAASDQGAGITSDPVWSAPSTSTMNAGNSPGMPRGFAPLPSTDDVAFTYIPPPPPPDASVADGSAKKKSRWSKRSD